MYSQKKGEQNSEEIFIIDTLLAPGDSIFINLEKSNRLETYQIPEYSFILPEILSGEKPPKIIECIAPILAQANIV